MLIPGFTNKEISHFFFPLLNSLTSSEKTETREYKCKCGVLRKQKVSAGHGNLVAHILSEHCDWFETMKNMDPANPISEFLTKKKHAYLFLA